MKIHEEYREKLNLQILVAEEAFSWECPNGRHPVECWVKQVSVLVTVFFEKELQNLVVALS